MVGSSDDASGSDPDARPVGHAAGAPFELRVFLPYQLAVLASRVSRRFLESYREVFGFGVSEWRVLAHVATAGPLSVREIHTSVSLDKPTVSRAVKRLVEHGLLRRATDARDGRLLRISATPSGRAMFEKIAAIGIEVEAEILASLSSEERALLGNTFEKLHVALDRDALAPPRTRF